MSVNSININNFETILLDMDGTLLDLHFDLHFWMEFLPKQYAKKHNITEQQAIKKVHYDLNKIKGTLDWYCVDYWTKHFDMPITKLKKETSHLIAVHPFVEDFLIKVKKAHKKIFLVTNAHRDVIDLKMELTKLDKYFDKIISSHDYGFAKEEEQFWHKLNEELNLNKQKTCFFDDSLNVLQSAEEFGIKSIAISKPSSKGDVLTIESFMNIQNFQEVLF